MNDTNTEDASTPDDVNSDTQAQPNPSPKGKHRSHFARAKKPVKILYAVMGVVATIGGTVSAVQMFTGQNSAPLTSCVSLTPELQAQIIAKLDNPAPSDITRVIQAMTCQLPEFSGNFAALEQNTAEGQYANAVKEIAESPEDLKRQALVLIADATTRTAGLDKLAGLAKTEKEWREVAALAYPWDVGRSQNAFEHIISGGSRAAWDHVYLSRLYQKSADLSAAQETATAGLALSVSGKEKSALLDEIGNIAAARNDLDGAQKSYGEALEIARHFVKSDPGNKAYQYSLSISYDRIGHIALQQNQLSEAMSAYEKALHIRQKLSKAVPKETDKLLNLFVSYNQIGAVAHAQNNIQLARESYEKAHEFATSLAHSEPLKAKYQLSLSISLERLADIDEAAGNLSAAKTAYFKSRDIRIRLAESDPSNAQYQRGLYVIVIKIGDLLLEQGDLGLAQKAHKNALSYANQLSEREPSNTYYREDMFISYDRLGKIAMMQKDWLAARSAYQSAIEIVKNLIPTDPDKLQYKHQLATSYGRLGDILRAEKNRPEALEASKTSLEIAQSLSLTQPSNLQYSWTLARSHARVGSFRGPEQIMHFKSAIRVLETIDKTGKMQPQQRDLYEALQRAVSSGH